MNATEVQWRPVEMQSQHFTSKYQKPTFHINAGQTFVQSRSALFGEGHYFTLSSYFVTIFASLMKAQVSAPVKLLQFKQSQFVHTIIFSFKKLVNAAELAT